MPKLPASRLSRCLGTFDQYPGIAGVLPSSAGERHYSNGGEFCDARSLTSHGQMRERRLPHESLDHLDGPVRQGVDLGTINLIGDLL